MSTIKPAEESNFAETQKFTLGETPGIIKLYKTIFIFSLRSIPRSLQRLFRHQDGWLYQPLPPGGAEAHPVPAEVGVRNPHKRYISMCSHAGVLSEVFHNIFIFITFIKSYTFLTHLDFFPTNSLTRYTSYYAFWCCLTKGFLISSILVPLTTTLLWSTSWFYLWQQFLSFGEVEHAWLLIPASKPTGLLSCNVFGQLSAVLMFCESADLLKEFCQVGDIR